MKIKSAIYVKSFADIERFDLESLPGIAFIGRSNVGKSSLINSLLTRKSLVKTSSTPGKTQLLNFFLINEAFYFIDLPGYGFAKVPPRVKEKFQAMISKFFFQCPQLALVIQILDIRHSPTKEDLAFRQMVASSHTPLCVVANKSDKLKKGQVPKALKHIQEKLQLETPPLLHSLPLRIGKEQIWEQIARATPLDT